MRRERRGARVGHCIEAAVLALAIAICVFGGSSVADAGQQASAAGWDWARSTTFWDASGAPLVPRLVADPTGQRRGVVLAVDFCDCGWQFYCSNGSAPFHFEQGRDYTLVFDVYGEGGYRCATDVCIVGTVLGACVDSARENVEFIGDGQWHRIAVHVEHFLGSTGDYYLWLSDQAGCGCWCIGDIRLTSGLGHSSK